MAVRFKAMRAGASSLASVIGMAAVLTGAHVGAGSAQALDAGTVPVAERWTATFATAARYYSWSGTRGMPGNGSTSPGSGTLVHVPFALQLLGQPTDDFRVELLARGGWVSARQDTPGLSGEVGTFTDTLASGTVTYLGFGGLQPFVSMDINAPTGRSALFGSAANARMDPDLVDIDIFGEGWNIGPSIGANIAVTDRLMATLAAGYTWRGVYDREISLAALTSERNNQQLTRVDPGDLFTVSGALAYEGGPWTAKLSGAVWTETATLENGAPLFRAGTTYQAGLTIDHAWQNGWGVSTLTGNYWNRGNNDVRFVGAAALAVEPFNTNSNVYSAGFQHLWQMGDFWFGPVGSVLYRDRNGYDLGTLQYVPAKLRYTAGVTAHLVRRNGLSLDLRAEHMWMHEGETTAINGQMYSVLANGYVLNDAAPQRMSTGWRIGAGLSLKF